MIALNTLKALPAFREYDDRELAVLLGSSSERNYAAGELLCAEGQRGKSCFLLLSGEVEVTRSTPDQTIRLGRFGAGTFLGQIALIDANTRTKSMRAVTAVGALEFTREVFEALLRAQSPLAQRFQRQIAVAGIRKLRATTQQLLGLLAGQTPTATTASQPPERDLLRYIQSAADEWGIPIDDVKVVGETSDAPPRRRTTRPPPRRA